MPTQTQILATDPKPDLQESVAEAVRLLRVGETVALPTETVYGLAADALDPDAVARIFAAKNRPSFDPLIVHLHDPETVEEFATLTPGFEELERKLMNRFWPGPLTLLLTKTATIPDIVTAGLETVAVRQSRHPVFLEVIAAFGGPLAAPSANRFGRISPTSASAVLDELDGHISCILDGGACHEGLESTIVRVQPGQKKPEIHILRPGPITPDDLKPYGKPLVRRNEIPESGAPGQTGSHYAPRTPLRLVNSPEEFNPEDGKRYALLSLRGLESDGYLDLCEFEEIAVLSPGAGKLPEAAVRFFHALRQLDQAGADEIIAEPIPKRGLGIAMMERLGRASV